MRAGIDDVVFEKVRVVGAVLNLKFSVLVLGVVVIKAVIDDYDVIAAAAAVVAYRAIAVAANRNTHRVCVVEDIVANGHIAAVQPAVLGSNLYIEVAIVHQVALEHNILTPVAVKSVGIVGIALARILEPADVVNGIPADLSVRRPVVAYGTDAFAADGSKTDVVVVVNHVVADGEIGHIAIDIHGLAVAGLKVVHLIAADRDLSNRSDRSAIYGDAKSVAGSLRGRRNVVHEIVEQLYARARTCNPDACRSESRVARRVIADFKTSDGDVALVHYIDQALDVVYGQLRAVDYRRLPGIVGEGDWIRCGAGRWEIDRFVVHTRFHIDCRSGGDGIGGVLNGEPRSRVTARVGFVVSVFGNVERGCRLRYNRNRTAQDQK